MGQIKIERVSDLTVRERALDFKMGNKSPRMHAGISPGAAVEANFFAEYLGEMFFEEFLQGLTGTLALPAVVMGALKGD